jgi:hypothetical protein
MHSAASSGRRSRQRGQRSASSQSARFFLNNRMLLLDLAVGELRWWLGDDRATMHKTPHLSPLGSVAAVGLPRRRRSGPGGCGFESRRSPSRRALQTGSFACAAAALPAIGPIWVQNVPRVGVSETRRAGPPGATRQATRSHQAGHPEPPGRRSRHRTNPERRRTPACSAPSRRATAVAEAGLAETRAAPSPSKSDGPAALRRRAPA